MSNLTLLGKVIVIILAASLCLGGFYLAKSMGWLETKIFKKVEKLEGTE